MGGRDHSETCETCGYQSGGLDDLLCACQYNGIKDATPDSVGSRDIIERLSRGAWNAHDGTTVVRLAVAEAAVQAAADTARSETWDAAQAEINAVRKSAADTRTREILAELESLAVEVRGTGADCVRVAVDEVARRFPVSDCDTTSTNEAAGETPTSATPDR